MRVHAQLVPGLHDGLVPTAGRRPENARDLVLDEPPEVARDAVAAGGQGQRWSGRRRGGGCRGRQEPQEPPRGRHGLHPTRPLVDAARFVPGRGHDDVPAGRPHVEAGRPAVDLEPRAVAEGLGRGRHPPDEVPPARPGPRLQGRGEPPVPLLEGGEVGRAVDVGPVVDIEDPDAGGGPGRDADVGVGPRRPPLADGLDVVGRVLYAGLGPRVLPRGGAVRLAARAAPVADGMEREDGPPSKGIGAGSGGQVRRHRSLGW